MSLARVSAGDKELTTSERGAARKLYDTKCTRCHERFEPGDYSPNEWQLWMSKMRKKAKLSSAEEELLKRYVESIQARREASKSATERKRSIPSVPGRKPAASAHKTRE